MKARYKVLRNVVFGNMILIAMSVGLSFAAPTMELFNEGKDLYSKKQYVEAIDVLTKVVSKYPGTKEAAESLLMIGESKKEIGRYCPDEMEYNRDPKAFAKHHNVALYRKYIAHIKASPNDFRYYSSADYYWYQGGVYKQLMNDYDGSEYGAAGEYYLILYDLQRDWEGGLEEAETAIEIFAPFFQKYPKSKYIKSAIEILNSSISEIQEALHNENYPDGAERVNGILVRYLNILGYVEKTNDESVALYEIATNYYKMKKYTDAKDVLTKLLRLSPGYKKGTELLAQIQAEKK